MTLTLVSVAYQLPISAESFRARAEDSARQIAEAPGLVWKIWGLDAGTGAGTSFYMFRDAASAHAFTTGPALAALRDGPARTATVRVAPVDLALSSITRAAPALAAAEPPLSIAKDAVDQYPVNTDPISARRARR